MKAFLVLLFTLILAGCVGGKLPEVSAEVESTSLANVRSVNVFSVSLPGEKGEKFNVLIENQLNSQLGNYVNSGARWTITVIDVDYVTPNFKQKQEHYKLSLEAEMVDMNGVRGWHANVETSEVKANPDWSEQRVREHLAVEAVSALVEKLPLGRIELGEEKLK